MRVLHTERLRLAPVSLDNAELLWRLLQQPGLREFQDLPSVDLGQFRRMVGSRPPRFEAGAWGRFEWLIFFTGVKEAIGWLSLRVGERASTSAEIGYSVVEGFRGRGIATECVKAIVGEAFSELQLRKVRAYCVPQNRASRAVLDRVGFQEDGVLTRGATLHGKAVDVLSYVIDRERWMLRRPA
jgi:ribosomal-protein-alanine N-acetyltransferase